VHVCDRRTRNVHDDDDDDDDDSSGHLLGTTGFYTCLH